MDDAVSIRKRGWRQGSVLIPNHLDPEIREKFSLHEDSLLFVLTQDCDLVQPDFEKEPYVELLEIRPVSKVDGNYEHGRNARKLDFFLGEAPYRASCHDRHRLNRGILANIQPSGYHPVERTLCDLIADWMAKRYTRPAFPDEFNRRLASESRAIRKLFTKHGHRFERVLIACMPPYEELTDAESYQLNVWLVQEDGSDGAANIEATQEFVTNLEQMLQACRGIEVIDCLAVLESEVSLAHLRYYAEWDFDFLTYREQES